MRELFNYDLEKHVLSGLMQIPECYFEISQFIGEEDFYKTHSSVHRSIFQILKLSIESGEHFDEVLIAEKIKSLGIDKFEEGIDPLEYLQSLTFNKVNQESLITACKQLKTLTIRREFSETGLEISTKMKSLDLNATYDDIIHHADQIFHKKIDLYESGTDVPVNIYSSMEEIIEERGNNPIDEFGLTGPHQRLQEIYGSLLRPGNITVIVARSGIGKTQFCMDFCSKVSVSNEHVPVLHFDNGEMSLEELTNRQCAALSGVQLSLIETGRWREAGPQIVNKVRSTWDKIKKMKFYYYNCGGYDVDHMINILKRFYYTKVGRGNEMIFSFDYIKTTFQLNSNKSEWQVVGEMVDKFKRLVQKDVLFDGDPVISMMTSVQSNRSGITNNRRPENIVEDESIVSLSDRITQFSSHLFSLRQKSNDEMLESSDFGTHKLVCFKHRHLGSEYVRALQPVRLEDGSLVRNSLFLNFDNFNITECGDMQDFVDSQAAQAEMNLANPDSNELPDI